MKAYETKKKLALSLAVAMVASSAPVLAFADTAIVAQAEAKMTVEEIIASVSAAINDPFLAAGLARIEAGEAAVATLPDGATKTALTETLQTARHMYDGLEQINQIWVALGAAGWQTNYGTEVAKLQAIIAQLDAAFPGGSAFLDNFKTAVTETGLTYDAFVAIDVADVNPTAANIAAAKEAVSKIMNPVAKANAELRIETEIENQKLAVVSVSAINAKGLKVTFNKAVDTTKAVFAVKRSGITANVSKTEWNEEKTEATLTFATKLIKGDYEVTASGVAEEALVKTVAVENERVAEIKILSTNAVTTDAQNVTVGYKVLNQYGEDATKTFEGGLTFTAGKGTVVPSNGIATLTVVSPVEFVKDEKVTLSILDATTATFVSKVLTVSAASSVSEVSIKELYNADGKTLAANSTATDFKLIVEGKDQYGSPVKAAALTADTIVTVSDTSVLTVGAFADAKIDGKDVVTLPLASVLKGGKATVTIISKTTGNKAQFEITVQEAPVTDVITLSAPELAVAGEKVEIPFSVTDQFGNELTKFSALNSKVTFNDANLKFVQNYVDGTAKLVYDATSKTAAEKITLTATTEKAKLAVMTLDLKAPAKAEVITSTKNVVTNVAVGGTFDLTYKNLVVKDQYGRDFDLTGKLVNAAAGNAGKYKITVVKEEATDTVLNALSAAAITGDVVATDKVTVTGKAKGTTTLTLELEKSDGTNFIKVANSALEINVAVAENKEFESYEVKALDPIYDNNAPVYQRAVEVYGVKSNGSKVKLTSDLYSVSTDNTGLSYTSGKLVANGSVVAADGKDVTVKVTVVVAGEEGPVILNQDVVVTKPALTIAEAKWDDGTKATLESGVLQIAVADATTTTNLEDALKLKDQFGGNYPLANHTVTITNVKDTGNATAIALTNNGTATVGIANAEAGNTFNMTIVVGGNTYTIPVVVIP